MKKIEKIEKIEKSLRLIERHESLCAQIRDSVKNKDLHQDEAEIELNKIRKDLLVALELSMNTIEEQDLELFYENNLFSNLMNQISVSFGFNKAMEKYESLIKQYNDKFGEPIFDFDRKDTENIIYNLNKISLIKILCDTLGLTIESDKIINNVIDKYFRPQ